MTSLAITALRLDGDTQPWSSAVQGTVDDYAERMEAGESPTAVEASP